MRWFILLLLVPLSAGAQSMTAVDVEMVLSEGKTSARFAELVNSYAAVEADLATEARIAALQRQIQRLDLAIRANRVRQVEIEKALSVGAMAFSPEQLSTRRDAAMTELRAAVKWLAFLAQLTAWVQSGGTNEPAFSMEELESAPPQQAWEEIHQLSAKIRELHRRILNPGRLSSSERDDAVLSLRQEQIALTSAEQPMAAAREMLEDHLKRAIAEPRRAPEVLRASVKERRNAIQILLASPEK